MEWERVTEKDWDQRGSEFLSFFASSFISRGYEHVCMPHVKAMVKKRPSLVDGVWEWQDLMYRSWRRQERIHWTDWPCTRGPFKH